MSLEIEDRDLGAGYVEGYFTIHPRPAYLALQPDLSTNTKKARVIEAAGLCEKPPKSGMKVMLLHTDMNSVDEAAVLSMQRVVDNYISDAEVEEIKLSYRASEFKDVFWIGWDCDMHPHTVLAVLRNLQQAGELPFD